MARKKKRGPQPQWIGNWTVSYKWSWNGKPLTSRCQDFKVKQEVNRRASTWFTFDRYVVNNDNGAVWVDGFDPQGGFVSFRPENITAIRMHREVKKTDAEQSAKPETTTSKKRGT